MAACLIVLAYITAGCLAGSQLPPGSEAARVQFTEAVRQAKAAGEVDLAAALPGQWDRLAVFPAYTSDEDARQLLGFDFHAEGSAAYVQDALTTVAFFDGERLDHWFSVSSQDVDMSAFHGPSVVSKAEARFGVDLVDGHLSLRPGGTP